MKLGLLHDTDEMIEMKSCVAEFNSGNEDDTIYAIGSFSAEVMEELCQMFNTPEEDTNKRGDRRGKRKKDSKGNWTLRKLYLVVNAKEKK